MLLITATTRDVRLRGSTNLIESDCLLPLFHHFRTRNPRGKAYSRTGLAHPCPVNTFAIDDEATWQEIFRRAAMYIIERSGRLDR